MSVATGIGTRLCRSQRQLDDQLDFSLGWGGRYIGVGSGASILRT